MWVHSIFYFSGSYLEISDFLRKFAGINSLFYRIIGTNMNIKVHTPKSLKLGSGLSSLKQLLLSLVATTISIVLTFGTAALIENRKKESEKREMVMMILSDMSNYVDKLEATDSVVNAMFESQLSILEQPESFESRKYEMAQLLVVFDERSSTTVENIFSSNVETVKTLGNILFTEKVSEFYLNRKQLYDMFGLLKKELFQSEGDILSTYDNLAKANLVPIVGTCENTLHAERRILSQCQQMMDVGDSELAEFASKREALSLKSDTLQGQSSQQKMDERLRRFWQALEAGRQNSNKAGQQ